jgi:dienelactone hydrolase
MVHRSIRRPPAVESSGRASRGAAGGRSWTLVRYLLGAGCMLLLAACSSGGGAGSPAPTLTLGGSPLPTSAANGSPAVASGEPGARNATPTVISDASTRAITVWTPDGPGPWPIVYAVPGASGDSSELAILGQRLAADGYLVFVTDHVDFEQGPDFDTLTQEVECGYRYVLSVADRFGGDPNAPITMVGHSLGAGAVVHHGLHADLFGPGGSYDPCFSGAPRPSVIAAIAGCYYGLPGQPSDWDTSAYANKEAHLVLIGGSADDLCPAKQSEDATKQLRSQGYDATVVKIDGADHGTLIYMTDAGPDPGSPYGAQVAAAIEDAIQSAHP